MGKATKKQLVLEFLRTHHLESAGASELHEINRELSQQLGPDRATSLSYIASVLRQAGVRVDYNDRFSLIPMEEPYASRLNGTLQFGSLESARVSLEKLDAAYREFRTESDRIGTTLVRSLVIKGKERAESLAANPRVSDEKRIEKREIGHWFKVWLDVPDLFFDWLELRLQSNEFQRQFGSNGRLH